VFEEGITEICEIVHEQRRPGLSRRRQPQRAGRAGAAGEIGADVCHMNLHKTFCIPHGGGGPGVGPIGVKAHLAPFLPGHSVVSGVKASHGRPTIGQVAAAAWGSRIDPADLLDAYIAMMGALTG
jgi:glycine dehydrogenase